MKIPDDVICGVCAKCFCCPDCRFKHEIKCHAITVRELVTMPNGQSNKNRNNDDKDDNVSGVNGVDTNHATTIYLFCPICAKKPLLLKEAMYFEMLEHIKAYHLPLNCQKCFKIYTTIEDLNEFSKCVQSQKICMEGEALERPIPQNQASDQDDRNNIIQTTIATQTSPLPGGQTEFGKLTDITPMSMINVRLKSKTKITHEEFISDSVSSIRNISSINNSSGTRNMGILSNNTKGTLVRTTSTPLQTEIVITKPKERTFNVSTAVSSIYNSANETEGSSAPVQQTVGTPSQQSLELNRFRKVGAGRSRMPQVTPLRQIMSRSVQKAIAEHGRAVQEDLKRRKIFESSDGSLNAADQQYGNMGISFGNNSPLDLRLSPALRRNCNNGFDKNYLTSINCQNYMNAMQPRKEMFYSSKKTTTTESIVITRLHNMAEQALKDGDKYSMKDKSNKQQAYNALSCDNINQSSAIENPSNCNTFYQTCRSVEIITSTETKSLKFGKDSYCSKEQESVEEVLPGGHGNLLNAGADHQILITPRTRIKGAVIKKNHIVFETPNIIKESSPLPEIFYTPQSSPAKKDTLTSQIDTIEKITDSDQFEELQKPSANCFTSPQRPSLRNCRIENIDNTLNDIDDISVTRKETKPQEKETKKPPTVRKSRSNSTGLWSLVSSVIRLPSFTSEQTNSYPIANSLIKRCSSIAGSIVRPKPLAEGDSFQSLKRKRTFTMDSSSNSNSSHSSFNQSVTYITNNSTSKRFRIHGRKPIQRMRLNV